MSKPKAPRITPSLKQAVEVYLLATSTRQVIEPIVVGYQTKILARHQFPFAEGVLRPSDPLVGQPVLDPRYVNLLSEADFQIYLAEVAIEDRAHGFNIPYDRCPLLIAKDDERKAERLVLQEARYLTNIDPDELGDMDLRAELLKLTVDFVIANADIATTDVLRDTKGDN